VTEKETGKTNELSRREFLKDAGLVVGGATVGSMAILSACQKGETVTKTETRTVTTTVGTGSTVTVTSPPTTISVSKYVCPLDNKEFPTLDALKTIYPLPMQEPHWKGLQNWLSMANHTGAN